MSLMTSDATHRRYHEILAQWRSAGRRISWLELREAFELAKRETVAVSTAAST